MNPLRSVLRPVRRLHRRVLLHRRPLAALTVAGAVLVGLQAVAPAPPETVTVWTARRDLPSGTVLQEVDLVGSPYSPDTVPAEAVDDVDRVVGRTLAAPMSRGEVMTETRTLASGLLRGYPGATAVPLRVTDAAVVDLLKVGDRVSFVVADPDGRSVPTLLLRDVPVVAIPQANDGGAGSGTPGRLVIAAVPSESASEVAARAATAVLIPVWQR
jgi:pilus assembly protein CpaB